MKCNSKANSTKHGFHATRFCAVKITKTASNIYQYENKNNKIEAEHKSDEVISRITIYSLVYVQMV